MQGFNTRYDVEIHSVRKRLIDVDGYSAKALIDGFCRVEGTILDDDTAKEIRRITFTQEKCKRDEDEKTIMRLIPAV